MNISKVHSWLKKWSVMDWVCLCVVIVANTGILIIERIFFPTGYPLWMVPVASIFFAIISAATYLRIWRPGEVTKREIIHTSMLCIIGATLFLYGLGGVSNINSITLKKIENLGFIGSCGLITVYWALWSFVRIGAYWVTKKADFTTAE